MVLKTNNGQIKDRHAPWFFVDGKCREDACISQQCNRRNGPEKTLLSPPQILGMMPIMFDLDHRPGLIVPEEMREILARNPGFIKTEQGGQRIADLYVQGK